MMKSRTSFIALAAAASTFALTGCVSKDLQAARNEVDAMYAVRSSVDLPSGSGIGLKRFAQTIAAADESVRAQAIDVEIARQENLGAAAKFEPEFYAEINRLNEFRQVNAQEFRSSGGTAAGTSAPDPFSSDTDSGKLGVRMATRYGATVDLFYQMDVVANSLQVPANLPNPEYSARTGANVSVPLLRGRGKDVNTADVKIAGIDEDIAQSSTRLVQAKRVYEGIRTYVMYQRAARHVALRQEVLDLTEQLAAEIDKQVASGLRNSADVTEARAQVAQRRAALTEAIQERDEHLAAFQIFFSAIAGSSGRTFVPADGLTAGGGAAFALDDLDKIMARRPEVQVQALEIEKREVETILAENATRPELNLNVDVAKTRLEAKYVPFRSLFGAQNPYHSWRVGFEYRRGLLGDQKPNAELRAAVLREKQAELTMNALRQKLAGEVNSTRSILIQASRALSDQSALVREHEKLVADERGRAAAGLSTSVETATREIELLLAREAEVDALAQVQLANNLAAHVSGKLLDAYGIQ